ncbi:MAG: zinc-ribbon domain-containing protein [Gaiellales bacterium]
MIVCKDCGHKNQNATTFCEACGTFLEWAGESVLTGAHQAIPAPEGPVQDPPPAAEVAPPAQEPPPPAPAAPPATPPPPAEASGVTGAAFQAQRLPVIAEPPPPAPAAPDEPTAPAPARPGTQVLRAMRMKARPAAKPAAPSEGPAARPPAEEHERRAPRPPSAEPPRPQGNPGDVFCSSCGTPNDPSRHYCRSCGTPLAGVAPVVAPHVSWWRRLLGRRPKAHVPLPAGARPEGGAAGAGRGIKGSGAGAVNSVAHVARRFFQVIAVLGALGIAVVAIGPWRAHAHRTVQGWLTDVRRIVQPHYVVVVPDTISATSSLKADPPQNAFDGVKETFWAEAAHGDGKGQSLTVRFTKPVSLTRIGVLDGDQSTPEAFATRPLPRALDLIFYDARGAVVKRVRIGLEQTPSFQKRSAEASGVSRLVIRIAETYPSEKGKRSSASIAEIELFRKD